MIWRGCWTGRPVARTPEGRLLTQQHRRMQLAVRAAALRDIQRMWSAVDPTNLAGTIGPFAQGAALVVRARNRESASTSARYYREFRRLEGVGGTLMLEAADPPSRQVAEAAVRGAGLAGIINARKRGFSAQASARNGFVKASGTVSNLALAGGRKLLVAAAKADPQTGGRWQRVTSAEPCDFCAMTASRGPVYSEQTVDFEAHSHCGCTVEPVFPGSELPPASRRFAELVEQVGEDGLRAALGNN